MEYAIGIDLGGTSIKYALVDKAGNSFFEGKLLSFASVSAAKAMGITPKASTRTKRSEILRLSAVAMMFPFMKITPADDRQRLR